MSHAAANVAVLEPLPDGPAAPALLEPEIVLPERLGHLGLRCATPEHRLMLAVLEDAIRAYLSHEPRARMEAEQWVLSRQRRSVFSIAVECETLGLEPNAVRGALRRLRAQDVSPDHIPRRRPNARRRTGIARDPGPEE